MTHIDDFYVLLSEHVKTRKYVYILCSTAKQHHTAIIINTMKLISTIICEFSYLNKCAFLFVMTRYFQQILSTS